MENYLCRKKEVMLQRIQTVYLLLAAASLCLLFFFPICFYDIGDLSYSLNIKNLLGSDGSVESSEWGIGLMVLAPISLAMIVFMLSQFKERQKQLSLGRVIYLLLATLIVISMAVIEYNKPEGAELTGYWLGYVAPVAALPFVFLANRAIKKDEELVKSLDRLR